MKKRREVLGLLSAAAAAAVWPLGASGEAQEDDGKQQDSQKQQGPVSPSAASAPSAGTQRETVTGIGGVFFRAHDPSALGLWYQQHLGISVMPSKETDPVWEQQAGQTVFAPFPEKTTYFGDTTRQWMMNFRVRDLERMAAQLQAAGVAVKIDPEVYPNGRFARIHDPEGNPIELWQPAGPGAGHHGG